MTRMTREERRLTQKLNNMYPLEQTNKTPISDPTQQLVYSKLGSNTRYFLVKCNNCKHISSTKDLLMSSFYYDICPKCKYKINWNTEDPTINEVWDHLINHYEEI